MDLNHAWLTRLPSIDEHTLANPKSYKAKTFTKLREPLIIRDGAASWPATDWTLSGIAERLKGQTVAVARDPTKNVLDGAGKRSPREKWEISEYIRLIEHNSEKVTQSYLSKVDLFSLDPSLAEEIEFFENWRRCKNFQTYSWISPKGSASPLHYDLPHNIFAQILGEKIFLITPPLSRQRMQAYPLSSQASHISRIEPDPDMRANLPWENFFYAHLFPGDILVLPSCWWHYVYSVTNSVSVNGWMIDLKSTRPETQLIRRLSYWLRKAQRR